MNTNFKSKIRQESRLEILPWRYGTFLGNNFFCIEMVGLQDYLLVVLLQLQPFSHLFIALNGRQILQLSKDTNRLQLPISTLYFRSFGSNVQKASFCAKNYDQNLHFLFTDFLGKKTALKLKVCIQGNSQGHNLVSSCNFFSPYFCWTCFSHFP